MKTLFVCSLSKFSGKNVISIGFAKMFTEIGLKVGYFRPIGAFPIEYQGMLTDEDAIFFKKVLDLEDDLRDICPVVINSELIDKAFAQKGDNIFEKIKEAHKNITRADRDILIISGIGNIYGGDFLGLNEDKLITEFQGIVLAVEQYKSCEYETVDALLNAKNRLGDRLIGVVINMIPEARERYFKETVIPFLKSRGIETIGLIPYDSSLAAVSVKEVADILNAKIISSEDRMDRMVERLSIGAMNVESALKYFRRTPDKAVITGGDRSDIILAALETPTECLILTGSLYPEHTIITRADELGIPILLVESDTLTTVGKVETLFGHLDFRSESKIDKAYETVSNNIDIKRLSELIGISA